MVPELALYYSGCVVVPRPNVTRVGEVEAWSRDGREIVAGPGARLSVGLNFNGPTAVFEDQDEVEIRGEIALRNSSPSFSSPVIVIGRVLAGTVCARARKIKTECSVKRGANSRWLFGIW